MDEADLDVGQDKEHLLALCTSALSRIEKHLSHLKGNAKNYSPSAYELLLIQAGDLKGRLSEVHGSLVQTKDFSSNAKKEYSNVLRVLYSTLGSVLSAGNWQSPSFWHSRTPQAGSDAGHVSASAGDYKRDMHRDEQEYVKKFVKEYVDHSMRLAPFAYATSSGMAAITTVLIHLQRKIKKDDVVLAGKSSYFQNKWQLEKLFPGRVRYVDEFDTEGILSLAKELQPGMIFLDSICGAESLPIPNLHALIPALSKVLSSKSTLVLDNTGLGSMYQPLSDLPWNPLGMHFICIESLLKFHQFGLDRVGGGITWTPSIAENGLFETRMHLGTIIPDASVLALPEPDRELMDARLVRIGRNASLLAAKLDEAVRGGNTLLEKVIHPSLHSYEGYKWTKDMPFTGAFITLRFREGKRSVSHYDALVSRVQSLAKKGGVDIVGGTSFGFDTTRLYVTARYATNITEPFVRISVGTETVDEINALARVFMQAILT
jgi:cystathionine beta-lyase/cystathionine gamma-synthase